MSNGDSERSGMLGTFDFQSVASIIMQAEGVVEQGSLSLENGAFETGGADLYITGNVTSGVVIRNTDSVLIRGNILGNQRWPCRIEALGDVVVLGEASYASISGRNIQIGGMINNCKLDAEIELEAGNDVLASQISVGNFHADRRKFEALKEVIAKTNRERDATDRQRKLDEKRMYRRQETTRISIDIQLGNMILHKHKRIVIDLTKFYEMVGDRSNQEIDKALLEFFAKGVVGMLTRVNLQFLQTHKSRQSIFKGVVARLHDLILITRKFDRLTGTLQGLTKERDGLQEVLENRRCGIYIRGRVLPDVEFKFVKAQFDRLIDGEMHLDTHLAKLIVTQKKILKTDTGGMTSEEAFETMHGLQFYLQGGRIHHTPLGTVGTHTLG